MGPLTRREVRLGRMDNRPVLIDIELRRKDGERGGLVLSISGHHGAIAYGQIQDTVRELAQRATMGDATLDPAIKNQAELRQLVDIWERWHLNDLRAGCEHQRALGWKVCPGHYGAEGQTCSHPAPPVPASDEDMRQALRDLQSSGVALVGCSTSYRCAEDAVGKPCPECGYEFGSAWLFEELPAGVVRFLHTFAQGKER